MKVESRKLTVIERVLSLCQANAKREPRPQPLNVAWILHADWHKSLSSLPEEGEWT
jgi:hypothetical protein